MKKSISPAVAVIVIIVVLVVIFAVYKLTMGKDKKYGGGDPAATGDRPEGADSVGIELQEPGGGGDQPEGADSVGQGAAPPPG